MCKHYCFFGHFPGALGPSLWLDLQKSSMTQGRRELLEFYDDFPSFPRLISRRPSGSSWLLVISTFCPRCRNSAFQNASVYLS